MVRDQIFAPEQMENTSLPKTLGTLVNNRRKYLISIGIELDDDKWILTEKIVQTLFTVSRCLQFLFQALCVML